MELQIDIDRPVVEWLASMGYPVAGMPSEVLHGMLLREARQWQLSPSRLRDLIDEGAAKASGHAARVVTAQSRIARMDGVRYRFARMSI